MGTRARRDRLEVHHDLPPAVLDEPGEHEAGTVARTPAQHGPAPADVTPPSLGPEPAGTSAASDESAKTARSAESAESAEPMIYGVRTSWQSEAVRIEAAEFLVATRVQEDSRRRLARLVARLREQARTERGNGSHG